MSLREYNRKRSFEKSPEPPGKLEPRKKGAELRFVIQLHRATRLHYDFRLEMGGSFKSWAVPRGPSLNPNDQRLAVYVEDHPLAYGSFEGIIPRGNYGAGTVMIWDEGTYRERGHLDDSRAGEKAMLEGLENGHITFVLEGTKLHGEFALIRLKKGEPKSWLLVKKRDEFSSYKIPRDEEERSAVSGRTMPEIASESERAGDIWLPKRTSGYKRTSAPKPSKPNPRAPEAPARPAPKAAPRREARAAPAQKSESAQRMPRRIRPMEPEISRAGREVPPGDWLFTPLTGGVRALAEVEGKRAHLYSRQLLSFDRKFPALIEKLEGAGIHALLDGEISRDGETFRVFDLLYKEGEDLRLYPLKKRLAALKSLKLPSGTELAPALETPQGEQILARLKDSLYRSGVDPEWLELRGAKKEARDPGPVFTHVEKLFWKSERITKGDLIEYYRSVSSVLLPQLKDRAMSLHRFPHGSEEKGFYQKDFTSYKPRWMKTFRLYSETAGKSIDYVVCQNEETLLYLANLGCIEMNPWLSRTVKIESPDYLVIDIDPDEHGYDEVVKVALETRRVLEKVGAESFCKTSGATGMHICVPLQAEFDYETARAFAEAVCKVVHVKLPALTSLERNPAKRGGRMYLDFMQNRIGQTLASAYSVRPRPGATVSTPLHWSEVTKKLRPEAFTIRNTAKRLDRVGDLWAPMLERQVDISACMRKLKLT